MRFGIVLPERGPLAEPVRLGKQEFAVLAAMVRRPQVVMRPEDLALQAWGHRVPDDVRHIRHEIARIRRKLSARAGYLETVRNVGYRYNPTPNDAGPNDAGPVAARDQDGQVASSQ